MRMTLLLIPLLVANAYAGDSPVVVQAQPLAQTPVLSATGSPASVKAAAASKAVIGPKEELELIENDNDRKYKNQREGKLRYQQNFAKTKSGKELYTA